MKRSLTFSLLAVVAVLLVSSVASANCTQGFWKNHPEAWENCDTFTGTMFLGDVEYTKAELLQIFDQSVQGNGLVKLAHQLIAAKLNVDCAANGGNPTQDMNDADALIGSLVVPPIGAGFLDTATVDALNDALDFFNNQPGDDGGFGGCAPVSVDNSSWGRVKATYR